jgi:hypothetical protein
VRRTHISLVLSSQVEFMNIKGDLGCPWTQES